MCTNPKLVTDEEFNNIQDDEVDALARYLNLLAVARLYGAGKVTITIEGGDIAREEVTFEEGGRSVTVTSESPEMQFPPRPLRRRMVRVQQPGVIPDELKGVPACVETVKKHGGAGVVSIILKGGRIDETLVEYGRYNRRPSFVLQDV
jgi:hypothetical protein